MKKTILVTCSWAFLVLALISASSASFAAQGDKGGPSAPVFWKQPDVNDPPDTKSVKRLRFLTSTSYPPFNYLDANRQLAGLNIDLLRALCTELKLECTIAVKKWKDLIPALKSGEGDAVMAGLSITPANLRKASFTRPYFRTPARFVVKKTGKLKAFAPKDLINAHIGVINNSAHEAYLKAVFPRTNFVAYKNAAELRGALLSERIDAIFSDGVQLGFWLKGRSSKNCCEFRGGAYTESFYFGAGMAVAVTRGNNKLARILDYAFAKLSVSGKYAELVKKHIPLPLY